MSNNIYKRVAAHVTALYEENPHPNLLYHSLDHTRTVVQRAEEIGAHYQLNERQTLAIYIAAWFHDTGHLYTGVDKHEEKSVELMTEFMRNEEGLDDHLVTDIRNCIMATRMPQSPQNLPEEILCDADTYHLGTKEFKNTNKLLKKEFILRGYEHLTHDWNRNTLDLLEKHHFHTNYCKALLEDRKKKNIAWLRSKMVKQPSDNTHHSLYDQSTDAEENASMKKGLLARGVQTMFKQTSVNHIRLTQLADSKAHILISVNAIIISVILGVLVRRLPDSPHLTIPAIIFLASSLATIVIAILSARPMVTKGNFTREDVLNRKTNLIFFGNFYRAKAEEYEWAMATLIKDNDYLYSTLIKDIYQIGVVLARKYRLVHLAYNVFMIGLIVSVISFFIASMVHTGGADMSATIQDAAASPF